MKLNLKVEENKNIIGLFPGLLEEIENNIRELRAENEKIISPNKIEQKIISANEKYIKAIEQILPFGRKALGVMRNRKTEINDTTAIIFVLKGFTSYIYNRVNELNRIKKALANEKFYYRDSNKQIMLSGLNIDAEECDDEKIEDLSYIKDNLFRDFADFNTDTSKSTKKAFGAIRWVFHIIEDPNVYKKLPKRAKEELHDLVECSFFANDSVKTMDSLTTMMNSTMLETNSDEEFRICQVLFANYNLFLRRLHTDCWAFGVNNNL